MTITCCDLQELIYFHKANWPAGITMLLSVLVLTVATAEMG